MAPVGLFFLVALLLVWIYLRRLARRRRPHGRDLWNTNVRRLRRRHIERARTWEDRRRRAEEYATSWKIAPQFLKRPPGEAHPPEPPASPEASAAPPSPSASEASAAPSERGRADA